MRAVRAQRERERTLQAIEHEVRCQQELARCKAAKPPGGSVEQAFKAYSTDGQHMDGKSFMKLCRACNLIGQGLPQKDVDPIFATCAVRTIRCMDMLGFTRALQCIASKKEESFRAISDVVAGLARQSLAETEWTGCATSDFQLESRSHHAVSHIAKGGSRATTIIQRPPPRLTRSMSEPKGLASQAKARQMRRSKPAKMSDYYLNRRHKHPKIPAQASNDILKESKGSKHPTILARDSNDILKESKGSQRTETTQHEVKEQTTATQESSNLSMDITPVPEGNTEEGSPRKTSTQSNRSPNSPLNRLSIKTDP